MLQHIFISYQAGEKQLQPDRRPAPGSTQVDIKLYLTQTTKNTSVQNDTKPFKSK